jgi:hypothetical protein
VIGLYIRQHIQTIIALDSKIRGGENSKSRTVYAVQERTKLNKKLYGYIYYARYRANEYRLRELLHYMFHLIIFTVRSTV